MGKVARRCVGVSLLLLVSAKVLAGQEAKMLLPGEHVRLTHSEAGERQVLSLAGLEGAKLTVTARNVKGSHAVPTMTVFDPDGNQAAIDQNAKSSGKATVKGLTLGKTGAWRIAVATPADKGGTVDVATSMKVPLRFSWKTTATELTPVEYVFPAAPCGVVTVGLAAGRGSASGAQVELIAPSGAVLAVQSVAKGRATIRGSSLPQLGVYRLRVTGAARGSTVAASVRSSRKRPVQFLDVASVPDVSGFTPATTTNQRIVTFRLDGVGFADQQTVAVTDATQTYATSLVARPFGNTAQVDIDLAEVPPGQYSLRFAVPGGGTSVAAVPLTVTNREPELTQLPRDLCNARPYPLTLTGFGFDDAATVSLRRSADSTAIPMTIDQRIGHEAVLTTLTPAPFTTGPCDVELRDPDGSGALRAGAFDFVGPSAPPQIVRTYDFQPGETKAFYVSDAAYDDAHDRVLVAINEHIARNVFVLFDAKTLAVLDTLVVVPADDLGIGIKIHDPTVAWNATSGTFALGLVGEVIGGPLAGSPRSAVRVVSDTDIHQALVKGNLVSSGMQFQSRIRIAPNPEDGGYLAVWEEWTAAGGDKIRAQILPSFGPIMASRRRTVEEDASRYYWDPDVTYQGDGRFVIVWTGHAYTPGKDGAVRVAVTDAEGAPVADIVPFTAATSTGWAEVFGTAVARNPTDGSMLVTFVGWDGTSEYLPMCQRLAPVTAAPDPYRSLFDGLYGNKGGYSFRRPVWNATRDEFVVMFLPNSGSDVVRRIAPDGSVLQTAMPIFLENYEGIYSVLYSGSAPGTLGLARLFDGAADDNFDYGVPTIHVTAGPMR